MHFGLKFGEKKVGNASFTSRRRCTVGGGRGGVVQLNNGKAKRHFGASDTQYLHFNTKIFSP